MFFSPLSHHFYMTSVSWCVFGFDMKHVDGSMPASVAQGVDPHEWSTDLSVKKFPGDVIMVRSRHW